MVTRIAAIVFTVLAAAVLIACPPSGGPRPIPPGPPPPGGGGPAQTGKIADGGTCQRGDDCGSRVCEGLGCGADGGTCVSAMRACTRDYHAYCGCDGQTFHGSGTCPGQRYAHDGECKQPDGASCGAAGECESGVCEGQGCGDSTPGHCVAADRVCAQVMTDFCGCDGQTIHATSSCAGVRYASAGACAVAARPDGSACLSNAECASGTCEGQGCGDDAPGACAPAKRACTKDRRPYCGCDGQTFFTSGTCPARRYQARGACKN